MDTVGTIQTACASYMQRDAVGDFITATGSNIFYLAINNARRWAERARNFQYSQIDVSLAIASTGANIAGAYVDTSVTASGTLSPNVAGSFTLAGTTANGLPFYTRTTGGASYFLSYTGTAWIVSTASLAAGSNYWNRTTTSSDPAGTYTAVGTNTGTLTITQATGTVSIKTIQNVLLPVSGGDFYPIEFLTNDEWNERVSRQVGREYYNAAKTLEEVGVSTTNPVCFQQGQVVSLVPAAAFTFPVISRLSIVRWLPDYTTTTDTDYLIQRAPDFMMFQTLLEVNKYFKTMVQRQEGNLDEASLSANRDAAFQSLITWDESIIGGTTTPTGIPT